MAGGRRPVLGVLLQREALRLQIIEQEPAALAGDDGMEIVHRIMAEAKDHLNDGGGMMCELGRCGPALEAAYKNPFLWLSTENSDGEVFWIKKKNL